MIFLFRCIFALSAVLSIAMLPDRFDWRLETVLFIATAVLCLVALVTIR